MTFAAFWAGRSFLQHGTFLHVQVINSKLCSTFAIDFLHQITICHWVAYFSTRRCGHVAALILALFPGEHYGVSVQGSMMRSVMCTFGGRH